VTVPGVAGVPAVVVPQARTPDHPVYKPNYRPNYQPYYWDNRSYHRQYRSYYAPAYPAYRPYYTFKPYFRLNLGFWVGHPVVYPYYIPPYPYSPPYPYPYSNPYAGYPYSYQANTPSYSVQTYPNTSTSVTPGGLSFEITPPYAEVHVDGEYFGTVDQFSPTQAPLWLLPGRHRLEIRAPGFETMAFDVDVQSGQVIPYQGDLRRL
jgi:hypothetical protein